ncbi:hypothetical protein QSH57_000040 [Fusarium oxysporum f. sp. vasinfectum]|nr:hypothetical protein QSH57_000040 [Fusarium oxysporum f. sp. vasinfectum]
MAMMLGQNNSHHEASLSVYDCASPLSSIFTISSRPSSTASSIALRRAQIENGVLVTKCDYNPPTEEWTNNCQEMDGDEHWGEGGKLSEVLESRGLSGKIKPLFALDAESGEPYTLFELSGTIHFINAADDSLERVTYPQELTEILGTITDPDSGLADVSTTTVQEPYSLDK